MGLSLIHIWRRKGSDYAVGYGRPPKHSRFKKGQSGNPRGRRKGSKSASAVVRELLARKVHLREDGQRRKVPLLEAILLGSANLALKGDVKNILLFVRLAKEFEEALGAEADSISESEDLALLKTYTDRILSEKGDKA